MVDTHYTDMLNKYCSLAKKVCETGYCPDCFYYDGVQKERARELAKEIDNLGEK